MRNFMTPDSEKYSCNLNMKERIEFIFYLRFHAQLLTQYSINNTMVTVFTPKFWLLSDKSDLSIYNKPELGHVAQTTKLTIKIDLCP